MLFYILKAIRKNKGIFAFTTLAFFTISLIVPIATSAIYTSRALVKEDITKYSRGDYDLLVRSEKAISPVEENLGLVEENYLSAGLGGITMEQYQKIKSMDEVEVAAPVATVGYFSSAHNSIGVSFPFGKSYHINSRIYTYDGIKEYLLNTQDYYQIASNYNKNGQEGEPVLFLPPSVQGFSNSRGKIEYPIVLPQIWDMLVAIDFEQENKLMGLGRYVNSGTYSVEDKIRDVNVAGLKGREIPILINESAFAPMKIDINFEEYNINRYEGEAFLKSIFGSNKYNNAYLLNDSLKLKLQQLHAGSSKNTNFNLSSYLKPFKTTILNLSENGEKITEEKTGTSFIQQQGSLYYRASPIMYEGNLETLTSVPMNEKNGILIFRRLIEVGNNLEETIKNNEIINQFKVWGTIRMPDSKEEKLTGSPLGIYGDSYVGQYNGDEVNKELKRIFPTIEPGSFVPSAPRGYTTLEALKYLKPQEPIDAIRIRVVGIEKYDENAKTKIEQLATKINEQTGLHVDVVAGSSTRQILVSIKGLNSSNEVEKVVERWTTLGTAATIVSSWSSVGTILVTLFLICGLIFVINRVACSISSRQGEIGTLKALGWRRTDICRVIAIENLIAAILAVLLSSLISVILVKLYPIKYLTMTIPVYCGLFLLLVPLISYLFSSIVEKKVSMINIKLGDVSLTSFFSNISIEKMVMNNVVAYIKRSLLIVVQIALAGGLSVYTWLSLKATSSYISVTTLGNRVNATTSPMIAVLIIGALLLVIFTVIDRFSTIIMERKNYIGILRTLGWKEGHIVRLIAGEALLLSITGTIGAALLSLTSFKLMYNTFPVPSVIITAAFLVIIVIAILAGFYPLYTALKISPLDAVISRDIRTNISQAMSKRTIAIWGLMFILVASILTIGIHYISKSKGINVNIGANSTLMEKLSTKKLTENIKAIKDSGYPQSYIEKTAKALGFEAERQELSLQSVMGIKENTFIVDIDNKKLMPEKLYIDSTMIKNGHNSIKGKAFVLTKNMPKDIKGKVVIIDSDTSEEQLLANWDNYKQASAVIVLGTLINHSDEFNIEMEFEGVLMAKERQGVSYIVNIPGEAKDSKPWLLQVGIGSPPSEDNYSTIAAMMELLELLRDEKPKQNVKILFTDDGQEDFSRTLRTYLDKEEVSKILCIGRLGMDANLIFGIRNDEAFGKPYSMNFGENSLSGVMRNITFIDKDIPYIYNPKLMNLTPDDLMRRVQSISKGLGFKVNPTNSDNYSGFACMDKKISYAYMVCPETKKIDTDSLRKHIILLYKTLTE